MVRDLFHRIVGITWSFGAILGKLRMTYDDRRSGAVLGFAGEIVMCVTDTSDCGCEEVGMVWGLCGFGGC